jgi:hypothetical protein
MGMDIGLGTFMKIRRIAQWVCELSWAIDWILNNGRNDGKRWENELGPNNMYACPQLDTCHVGNLAHLYPTLELRIK